MHFDLNNLSFYTPKICDNAENREFAVLIPIVDYKGQQCIVLQVRSDKLLKQPSEICFPGGKIEPGESKAQAAVRETCEELLIADSNVKLLGEMDTLITPFNTIIYPFAAHLEHYPGSFSSDEVQEVFYVPIDFLMSYEPHCSFLDVSMTPREDFPFDKIQYGKAYPWAKGVYPVYLYEYEDKVIWGITARVLRNFIDIIKIKGV